MKHKNFKKWMAFLLTCTILLTSLMACSEASVSNIQSTQEEAVGSQLTREAEDIHLTEAAETKASNITVAYPQIEGIFSPFFARSAADMDASSMTQIPLLTIDRSGLVLQKTVGKETWPFASKNYDYEGLANLRITKDEEANRTTYTFTLRDDVRFSDGQALTADDLIFSLYVYLDPSYDGIAKINSLDIVGLKDYQSQTTEEVRLKYEQMYKDIEVAGETHVWTNEDAWTKEQQIFFWKNLEDVWTADIKAIVDEVYNNYAETYAEDTIGKKAEDLADHPNYKVALAMVLWGFGEITEMQLKTPSGKQFDLSANQWPSLTDFYAEAKHKYEGNYRAYWEIEKVDDSPVASVALSQFIQKYGPQDEAMGKQGIKSIEGIKKLGRHEVEIVLNGYSTEAIYRLGIDVSPLHFYGDKEQYDYEASRFGHPFGDLSIVKAKNKVSLGAGPYLLEKYEHDTVYFSANPNFYKGEAATPSFEFKKISETDVLNALMDGTVDLAAPSFNESTLASIKAANSNAQIQGDKLHTLTVDNLSYGYIGINADTVNVAGNADSKESKYLRTALATLFAVYREQSVKDFYGERAKVINYPVSDSSWATPKQGDENYRLAFSKSIEGTDLYTAQMDEKARYKQAIEAAKAYFLAAGYRLDEETGKFIEAPEGAKMSYEALLTLDAKGQHPNQAIFRDVKKALDSLGIELALREESDGNVLWDKIRDGSQDIWSAAWSANIDPDLYKTHHSANVVGESQSSESNDYHIRDAELDDLIVKARNSNDFSFRKASLWKSFDLIASWAVEIPVYQTQMAYVFNAKTIDIDSLAPAQTTFYTWIRDVDKLKLKG